MKRLLAFFAIVVLLEAQSLRAQWIQTNGPYGGDVNCFAVNGANLFAGTGGGGVFLSTNNGTSWTAVNTGLTNGDILALAVNGSNLFAGTDGGGVFLSTNNGTSWMAVSTAGCSGVFCLAVNGSNLFAGTDGGCGVFLLTNNGTSWTVVNIGLTNTISALAVNGSNLFAGTYDGVFLSTNNGTSWTAVNTGLTNTYVVSLAVNGSNLFAGTRDGVFLSTNNGTSWTAANTGLTNTIVWSFAVNGLNLFAGTGGSGVWRRPLSELVTEVEDDFNQVPVGFTLEQNYPNPFLSEAKSRLAGNPETEIRFALPQASHVVMKIFNVLGEEVRTLVDEQRDAGYHAVRWDGKDKNGKPVTSGIYLYKLRVGDYSDVKKMSLLR